LGGTQVTEGKLMGLVRRDNWLGVGGSEKKKTTGMRKYSQKARKKTESSIGKQVFNLSS